MARSVSLPLSAKVVQNVDETQLTNKSATLENAYINDEGGVSRFPRLVERATFPVNDEVVLHDWKNDLVASVGGRTYLIDENYNQRDVTKAHVRGSGRTIFAKTADELLMAAGGPIIKFNADRTEILSRNAPESTHVGEVDGYVVATEPRSGRFFHSEPGQYDVWNPLSVFSASGRQDDLNALIVTEFNELMLAGVDSIEQFEPAASGIQPFARRWFLGAGVLAPYTFLSVDNRVWGINKQREWVAFSSQLGVIESEDVQLKLEQVQDWTGAWAQELPLDGQRFMVLQIPKAINHYGSEGLTFLYDYRKKRWAFLYGWDQTTGLPTRWEGWSFYELWGKKFVGGQGKLYELASHKEGLPQRMLWRTGHYSRASNYDFRINAINLRIKRGDAAIDAAADPVISLRVNKGGRGFGRWARRSLGALGKRTMDLRFPACGTASSFQFEVEVYDSVPVEITSFDMEVDDND